MSEQFKAALLRAAVGGGLTAVAGFFLALQLIPVFTAEAVARTGITAAGVFFSYIVARGIIEGWIDTARNNSGNVLPSDVTASRRVEPVAVVGTVDRVDLA